MRGQTHRVRSIDWHGDCWLDIYQLFVRVVRATGKRADCSVMKDCFGLTFGERRVWRNISSQSRYTNARHRRGPMMKAANTGCYRCHTGSSIAFNASLSVRSIPHVFFHVGQCL